MSDEMQDESMGKGSVGDTLSSATDLAALAREEINTRPENTRDDSEEASRG